MLQYQHHQIWKMKTTTTRMITMSLNHWQTGLSMQPPMPMLPRPMMHPLLMHPFHLLLHSLTIVAATPIALKSASRIYLTTRKLTTIWISTKLQPRKTYKLRQRILSRCLLSRRATRLLSHLQLLRPPPLFSRNLSSY
jgi:hypothetical protein